ncbi:MobQ family relaxase [Metabacillus fastidiosus]
MAIYHFSAQMISRSKGQSAVASAAYRSGERLTDERTNETKHYKRKVKPETIILSPFHSPDWVEDRERLWNEVEKSETRKNSQLAREINIALPFELSYEEQNELILAYIQNQFVNKGMIADIAIHRDDPNNPHFHVMLTTREITPDGFGKKNREWNDRSLLEEWREQWADYANIALEKAGSQERISHLSNEARGIEQMPGVHLGHVAHDMEKKGIQTDRGNINRERQEYNAVVIDLQKYREEKEDLQKELARKQEQQEKVERFNTPSELIVLKRAEHVLKNEPSLSNIEKRMEQLHKLESKVEENIRFLHSNHEKIKEAAKHYETIVVNEQKVKESEQKIESINWKNVFKFSENRKIKATAETTIAKAQKLIHQYNTELNSYRQQFHFNTQKEFNTLHFEHSTSYRTELESNRDQLSAIQTEKELLQNAKTALNNAEIRQQEDFLKQLADQYPEHPEIQYLEFSAAKELDKLNKQYQETIPIEAIQKAVVEIKQNLPKEIQSQNIGLSTLEGILRAFEQADREMLREREINQQKTNKKVKTQKRSHRGI